jgi:hypothetical protein
MALVEYLHTSTGLHGTIEADGQGYYLVRVAFDGLLPQLGFLAARQKALAYGVFVQEALNDRGGCFVGDIDGLSRRGRPRKKLDLERTFVSFLIKSDDGSGYDAFMAKRFRRSLRWADQLWQAQSKGSNRG